jgi:hypothetical protein
VEQLNRLKWCKKFQNWTVEHWKTVSFIIHSKLRLNWLFLILFLLVQVIFSDETYVDVCGPQAHFVRRNSDEPIRLQHTRQHRPFLRRVMFWGAMLSRGPLPLIPVQGTMTSQRYITVLQDNIVSFLENQPLAIKFTFQHDNAPSHKAGTTTEFLSDNAVDVLSWPPYSPDLNPIENLWGVLKRKVREGGVCSIPELIDRVMQIWTSSEIKDVCESLVASMPRRVAKCIKSKGGYTKH